jgi:hypothetical protein
MLTRLVLAGILAVAVGAAQRGGGGGMGGGGGEGGMGGMGGGGGMDRGGMGASRPTNRMDYLSDMLKLDKEEKKQVKAIMDDGQKEAAPVKEEIAKTRTAIAEAVAAGKSSEEIKKAEAAYAAAAVHMHQIELGAFAKIYQILDKDQQAKAGQVYGMMAGVFHGKAWTDMN